MINDNIMNLITIEGNIGSGKSTLLKRLKEKYANNKNVVFIDEPLLEWQNMKDENDKNILENFYSDNKLYAFPFQIYAYITILNNLIEAYKKNVSAIFISERGIVSTKEVFAKMLYDNKSIYPIMYKIYEENSKFINTHIVKTMPKQIHNVIYVNTSASTCLERITKRSREGEESIMLEYLELCKKYHDNMIDKLKDDSVNILEMDGNIDDKKIDYDNIFHFIDNILKKQSQ